MQEEFPCTGCGSTCKAFVAASGTFSDGSGPYNYPNGADCRWMIAPSGVTEFTINFTAFSSERCCDFVRVYQCTDVACSSKQFLSELSGTYSTAQFVTSSTGLALVHFVTNSDTSYPGFDATWRSSFSASIAVSPLNQVCYHVLYVYRQSHLGQFELVYSCCCVHAALKPIGNSGILKGCLLMLHYSE